MINSILEMRSNVGGDHLLALDVPADEFFSIYEVADKSSAEDVISLHLQNRLDDGRVDEVDISHNKARNIVRITAKLRYEGNDHTGFYGKYKTFFS